MNGRSAFAPVSGSPLSRAMSATQVEAGTPEGLVLVMACWCTVLASGLLSPVLPQIARHFADAPHLDLMIGLVATMPALLVALLSVPLGALGDQIGQRRLLLWGFLLYGLAGIAPFWMDGLAPIIAARAVVGIGEAAVMTASTALIGLRFGTARRGRWLAAQVAAANTLGIAVLVFGGLLGLLDWHAPFLAYAFALLLLVPALRVVRAPAPAVKPATGRGDTADRKGFVGRVATICGLNGLATLAMFVIIIQLAFLLPERGATTSAGIGLGIACGATGVAAGAIVSGLNARVHWRWRVGLGFLLYGCAFVAIALMRGFWPTALAAGIGGFGGGLIIPALLATLIATAPGHATGRIVGVWTAATFVAQFLNPPVFIALRSLAGSQSAAIGLFGGGCLIAGAAILLLITSLKSEGSRS